MAKVFIFSLPNCPFSTCHHQEETGVRRAISEGLSEAWEKRGAILLADGHLLPADAAFLA